MSHKLKCGCVITDSKNPEVRKGFCVGGSFQSFCAEHDPKNQPKAKPKPTYTALSPAMPDDVAKSVNWLQGLCDIHNAGKAADMLERQQQRIAALEEANRKRKEMNAQMLMNAAESGNRNYLAEIEALQQRIAELEAELQYHREHSGCVETQCQIGLFLDCNIPVAPAQVAPLKQEVSDE